MVDIESDDGQLLELALFAGAGGGILGGKKEEKRQILKRGTSAPSGYNGFSGRKRLSDEVRLFLRSHANMASVDFEEMLLRQTSEFKAWAKKTSKKKTT